MAARDDAVALLVDLGAPTVDHLGSDLLTHLLGTEALLRSWDVPEPVALAGLCHAAYGTDGFPQALLPVDDRPRLAAAIGAEAETIVYRYGSCRRDGWPATFVDRFTGEPHDLPGGERRALALLTAANELDLTRRGVFDDATRTAIADLVDRLVPDAPADAAVLAAAAAEIRPTG
ncbi:MAG TPA: hypothetical protein VIL36_13040 [Acidimicrobiales bacterium]